MSPSLDIQKDFDLSPYNTMGVHARAAQFIQVKSVEELEHAVLFALSQELQFLVLGGGSNVLFINDFDGVVIHQHMMGKEILKEDENGVILKVQAGENWHELVSYCVDKGWGGIENLSLIPGSVGAAPIQNIGAYGTELEEVIVEVEVLHVETGDLLTFSRDECRFGYRDSIFKQELKGKVIVTSVILSLSKKPGLNLSYKALSDYMNEKGIEEPGIREVSEAVIAIRRSKLPDPDEIGNTGSFFKNPVISAEQFEELKTAYPEVPSYPVSDKEVKVPAGWLIEQAGWKGKRKGDAGMHDRQALVLVNHGNATGKELWAFAQEVKDSVYQMFDIMLTPEVNVIS